MPDTCFSFLPSLPTTDLFVKEKVKRKENRQKQYQLKLVIFKVQFYHPMRLRALGGNNYLLYVLTLSGMVWNAIWVESSCQEADRKV